MIHILFKYISESKYTKLGKVKIRPVYCVLDCYVNIKL